MLRQRHRFHGHNSLNRVYRQGQQARGRLLGMKYLAREPHKPYRVAVVVSRKVSKSAVRRNRIRRRIYEQVRLTGAQPGTDLVLTAYSEQLADIGSDELAAMVGELLKKAA